MHKPFCPSHAMYGGFIKTHYTIDPLTLTVILPQHFNLYVNKTSLYIFYACERARVRPRRVQLVIYASPIQDLMGQAYVFI